MTFRDYCRGQVARFSEFAAPPSLDEGYRQTLDTFERSARSERHARAIADAIIEAPGVPPRWPTSERIRAVAWELLSEREKSPYCGQCGGTGWVPVPQIINGITYDVADRCVCNPLPQMMAQAAENKAETAREQSRKLREVGL